MEYLVYLADVGMQVFLFFQHDEEKEVRMQVFQYKEDEEVRMEHLADVGNHVRKERVLYYVN
jgi:hypothetical protein